VLDDEQHLVVVRRERVLGRQDLVQAQVVAVAHGLLEVHLRAMPLGAFLLFVHIGFLQVTALRAALAS
jgi:hypothetical protein